MSKYISLMVIAISLSFANLIQAQTTNIDNTDIDSVKGLVNRLIPEHAKNFTFELINAEASKDVFEIETNNSKVLIRGNNGVAMAMGLNWYLKYYCHCHVSWCGNQLNMPETLPTIKTKIRKTSWAKHRYFLNYCCFGYSLPWWNWDQWERLIDWMALNGINNPLAITGQEAVWQSVCKQLDMNDEQITEFLAGPPYLPFQWMGCLDGFGGPLPQSWIDKHEELGKKILERERSFGMKPVLQGFTGHVPVEIKKKYPDAKLHEIHWTGWTTYLVDPLDETFSEIAKLYMAEQKKCFGTDHFYAADSFVEMTPPKSDADYLGQFGEAIYRGMADSDSNAVWVLQGWPFMFSKFWTNDKIKALLDSVPDENMLLLDMFCEAAPQWSRTQAFFGKPWLMCNIYVFGNVIDFGGATLNINHTGIIKARQSKDSGKLVGLGFVNEGLGYNPIDFDLMYEMAWRQNNFDLQQWKKDYFHYRYGKINKEAADCWNSLFPCFWVYQNRSIIETMPTLEHKKRQLDKHRTRVIDAWLNMLKAADKLAESDTYKFDLVNVTRGMLSYYASLIHSQIVNAHQSGNIAEYRKWVDDFMEVMLDIDRLLETRKEFLLGCWLEDAKRWATNDAQRDKFEWNARMILTMWARNSKFKMVNDCGRKMWAGMVRDYYLKRWEMFFDQVEKSMKNGHEFDKKSFDKKLVQWMENWSDKERTVYTTQPNGDSIKIAKKLWSKYSDNFKQIEITNVDEKK